VESDVNWGLRGESITNPFYNDESKEYDNLTKGTYFKQKWYTKSIFDITIPIGTFPVNFYNMLELPFRQFTTVNNKLQIAKEYFSYNWDYSQTGYIKPSYSLPFNWDYCKDCLEKYPFRVYYSDKSFEEQRTSSFKNIKINNYTDLSNSWGQINALFVDKNQLYSLTDKDLFFIPTREQVLQTNENTVSIGTGDVFSIPPKQVISLDYSYSGSKEWQSIIKTEFGVMYINDELSKVLFFRDGLNEISKKNMESFFVNNLYYKLNKQYKRLLNNEFPLLRNPYVTNGIGLLSTYDKKLKRIILTKKDYELTSLGETNLTSNLLFYDVFSQSW
jgi:hypothetical protein